MDKYELPDNFREMKLHPYKKEFSHSYVYGVFPTIELADNNPSAVFRIVASSKLAKGSDILREKAEKLSVPFVTDDKTIERLSPKENCFAIGVFKKSESELDYSRHHIVLANPSDMGNLGTIIRTLTAFGFKDLAIIRPAADIFNPHTVRASMGALFRIRVRYFDSFDEYLSGGGPRNCYPFMLNGSPMEKTAPDKSIPCSLIFGNESSGLPSFFEKVGHPVRIVHENTVDSLNLTIAAGIGIHWFINA